MINYGIYSSIYIHSSGYVCVYSDRHKYSHACSYIYILIYILAAATNSKLYSHARLWCYRSKLFGNWHFMHGIKWITFSWFPYPTTTHNNNLCDFGKPIKVSILNLYCLKFADMQLGDIAYLQLGFWFHGCSQIPFIDWTWLVCLIINIYVEFWPNAILRSDMHTRSFNTRKKIASYKKIYYINCDRSRHSNII